jgi:hypothetical protein
MAITMTTNELLKYQIDDAGFQLNKVFEGVDSSLDERLTEHAMSPREIAAHLGECYTAVITETSGGKHEWGTYSPSTTEWPALWNEVMELRGRASAAALSSNDWEKHASAFIPAHDYYHVGQMAMLRLTKDPGWDPYSIYNMG